MAGITSPQSVSEYELKRFRDADEAIKSICKILVYENWPVVPAEVQREGNFQVWLDGLIDEVQFWWVTIGAMREGYRAFSDDLAQRRKPFQHQAHLAHFEDRDVYVLDVGSGPFTTLGTAWDGRTLHISLADPLADVYRKLLEMFRIPWAIDARSCAGESLTSIFPLQTFHLVHAENSLDHSINPLVCIRQMLDVARPDGVVLIRHIENEARDGGYNGLHQWNFTIENGNPVIWNPDRKIQLKDEFPQSVHIVAGRIPNIQRSGHDWTDDWIEIVFRKSGPNSN